MIAVLFVWFLKWNHDSMESFKDTNKYIRDMQQRVNDIKEQKLKLQTYNLDLKIPVNANNSDAYRKAFKDALSKASLDME